MTLKQGSDVIFDTWKRFKDHNFQYVVLSLKTARTNHKGDIRAFSYAPFNVKDVI